jgi:hypothetical protein
MDYKEKREQMRKLRRKLYELGIDNGPSDLVVITLQTLNLEQLRKVKDSSIPVSVYINFDEKCTIFSPSKKFHYLTESRGKVIDHGNL